MFKASPEGSRDRLDDVMALSVSLAKTCAACANALIEKIGVKPRVIGSHGQTVRHRPENGFTVQLGSGAIIAEMTGVPTVTDFRAMDIALGGEGHLSYRLFTKRYSARPVSDAQL